MGSTRVACLKSWISRLHYTSAHRCAHMNTCTAKMANCERVMKLLQSARVQRRKAIHQPGYRSSSNGQAERQRGTSQFLCVCPKLRDGAEEVSKFFGRSSAGMRQCKRTAQRAQLAGFCCSWSWLCLTSSFELRNRSGNMPRMQPKKTPTALPQFQQHRIWHSPIQQLPLLKCPIQCQWSCQCSRQPQS